MVRNLCQALNCNTLSHEKLKHIIYDPPDNCKQLVDKFLEEVADVELYADLHHRSKTIPFEDLIGQTIDIRQNDEWYRTRITGYDPDNRLFTFDSTGLDIWPDILRELYEILEVDELRRSDCIRICPPRKNVLSFSEPNSYMNQHKTFYLNGKRITTGKRDGQTFTTHSIGNIDLHHCIRAGLLNKCPFNGRVARRYASAARRESNADRQGVT